VGLAIHGGKSGDVAERADLPPADARAMRLAAILDDADAMFGGAADNRLDVGCP